MADVLDELLALPPAEFVAARDQQVAALKRAGKKDEAAALKAITRPSPSVWAINQLARRAPEGLARFLAATDAVREAQASGGSSEESRARSQAAFAEQRAALEELLAVAEGALGGAGLSDDKAVLDKVANDLRWGVLDEATRAPLAAGRLLRDVPPPDFGALLGQIPLRPAPTGEAGSTAGRSPSVAPAAPPTPNAAHAPDAPSDAAATKATEAKTRAQAAAVEEQARREARERARAHLRTLKTELAGAEMASLRARADLAGIETQKAAAEARLQMARREVERAERDGQAAERARAQAAEALAGREAETKRLAGALAAAEAEAGRA